MSIGIRRTPAAGRALGRARRPVIAAVALSVAASVAMPALASAAPLQHGDLLTAASAGVTEYTPAGTFVQTLTGTAGATAMCVDPAGGLILPGVGRVAPSGSMATSRWASDVGDSCVTDGRGHVFIGTDSGTEPQIDQYGLGGGLQRTFDVDVKGVGPFEPLAIDLAPDTCTIYYGAFATPTIERFNVCTDTQESPFASYFFTDDLQTQPDGQLLVSEDGGAARFTDWGTLAQGYSPGPAAGTFNTIRGLSLDPDGSSFWVAGLDLFLDKPEFDAFRFNIATGAIESNWTAPVGNQNSIADYGPPMVGSAEIAGTLDTDAPGQAEAFATRAKFSGEISNLHLYLDGSSTASQAVIGVYSNRDGAPGELLGQTTIATPAPGSWNEVTIPPVSVTAGQRYWIALLGPAGGGTIAFRDTAGRGRSFTSAQDTLTALPAQWSSQQSWSSGSLSAYGNG